VYPILFQIPNTGGMSVGAMALEILLGVGAALVWLWASTQKREDWWVGIFSTATLLIAGHFIASRFLGPRVPIHTFGVVVVIGFLLGVWYMTKQATKDKGLEIESRHIFDFGMWLLLSGIVGARLLYVFLNYDEYTADKTAVFAIWQGGLVWYGSMIVGIPVAIFLMRRYKMPVAKTTDLAAAAMLLALGVGRWACLCMGDDYGRPTDLPWGIRFWDGESLIVQGAPELRGVNVHPTQLYMSVNALWLFFIVEVIRRRARYAGTALGSMLILYAVTRGLIIEPFRGDFVERNPSYQNHAAAGIKLKTDGVAFAAERNTVVRDANGVMGKLLADVTVDAETPEATVAAMTDEPWEGRFGGNNGWKPGFEDLPTGVTAIATFSRRYNSHLPAPPGYLSTSQTIGFFILLAGIGVLFVARKMKLPGIGPDAPPESDE